MLQKSEGYHVRQTTANILYVCHLTNFSMCNEPCCINFVVLFFT